MNGIIILAKFNLEAVSLIIAGVILGLSTLLVPGDKRTLETMSTTLLSAGLAIIQIKYGSGNDNDNGGFQ